MAEPLQVVFEGLLAAIAGVLLFTYTTFVRMNVEIRRARLFIMAQRIHRFLLAFTLGFLAIMAVFLVTFLGVAVPASVTMGAVFFFLGAVLYGSVEILLIAHPLNRRRGSTSPQEVR